MPQSYFFPVLPTAGIGDGTVGVERIIRKVAVGDGVTEGVKVAVWVTVGVSVGVMKNAVCVNAAFAVSAITVFSELGSIAGAGEKVVPKPGEHANITVVIVKKTNTRYFRRIILHSTLDLIL
jgi:hypothetical protein